MGHMDYLYNFYFIFEALKDQN